MHNLVKIIAAVTQPRASLVGSIAANSRPLVSVEGESLQSSWKRIWKSNGIGAARFFGPGSVLHLDRGEIASPLVYVCDGMFAGTPDASLIEIGLSVAKSATSRCDALPYWPSFRGASSNQRALYLDWLFGGRNAPQIPIGYVFIYFYGLERRILADQCDHASIAAELLRLLKIYGQSRSFVRYATDLVLASL